MTETETKTRPEAKADPSPAAQAPGAPSAEKVRAAIGSAAPDLLRLDAGVALLVVAVCVWKRSLLFDLADSSVLALALLLPVGNLAVGLCSLRAYKLREAALQYRMALGAVLTLYYGYLGLHVAGVSESPLGAALTYATGSSTLARVETGLALAALLLQTFIATDVCQKLLAALRPPASGATDDPPAAAPSPAPLSSTAQPALSQP